MVYSADDISRQQDVRSSQGFTGYLGLYQL